MLQAGWRPAAIRLHDPEAPRVNLARVLDVDVDGVMLILVFDGPSALVETEEREVLHLLTADGGRDAGRALAETWWENRFRIYYAPYKPELPSIWGSVDLAATFTRLLPGLRRGQAFRPGGVRLLRPHLHRALFPLAHVGRDGVRTVRPRRAASGRRRIPSALRRDMAAHVGPYPSARSGDQRSPRGRAEAGRGRRRPVRLGVAGADDDQGRCRSQAGHEPPEARPVSGSAARPKENSHA
jgi:hypothetical protein